MSEPTMTTYLVCRKGGNDQKVTVPSKWKVTFGPLHPGSKSHEASQTSTLRFYEAANRQRMVITDVVSFRDTAIKVEEKRVSTKQQTMYRNVPGGEKAVVVEGRMEEWVDPDKPNQVEPEFFRIAKSDTE